MEVMIMPFVEARCPQCKGDVLLDNEKEINFCMDCGTKIVVEEAIKAVGVVNTQKVETWMRMGKSAMEATNYPEAYDYFTKVVETNLDDWRALYYKAYASGCLSTLEKPRINELIHGIQISNNLMETANLPKEELIVSKNLLVSAIFDVYVAYIALLKKKIDNIIFSHKDKDGMRLIRGIYETGLDHHLMALDLIIEYDDDVSKSNQLKLKKAIVEQCARICFPFVYYKDPDQIESYYFGYSENEKEYYVNLYDKFIMEVRREIPEFRKDMLLDRLSPPPETPPKYESAPDGLNKTFKRVAHYKVQAKHLEKVMKAEEEAEKVRQEKEAQYMQEKYWKEHPEEYQSHLEKLKREKDRLEENKRNLQNEINQKDTQLVGLEKNNYTEISKLKEKRSKLGIFARKEKKEIDYKIYALEAECNKFTKEIEKLRRELKDLYSN
jgi:DNA-directed RNA polymerase subunit RPC12/RpoP